MLNPGDLVKVKSAREWLGQFIEDEWYGIVIKPSSIHLDRNFQEGYMVLVGDKVDLYYASCLEKVK